MLEIYHRRLYAFRGFQSFFDFVTRELGYSDAAASRRIAAMKLLEDIPEIEEKIKKGDLNLSNAAQAQRLFQAEEKLNHLFSLEKKKEILETLTQKSTRDAEKTLLQHSSQSVEFQKSDQIKPVTSTHSEIRFIADQTLLDQLEIIKNLLANKNPNLIFAELIAEMAKLTLEKLKPREPKRKSVPQSFQGSAANAVRIRQHVIWMRRPTFDIWFSTLQEHPVFFRAH